MCGGQGARLDDVHLQLGRREELVHVQVLQAGPARLRHQARKCVGEECRVVGARLHEQVAPRVVADAAPPERARAQPQRAQALRGRSACQLQLGYAVSFGWCCFMPTLPASQAVSLALQPSKPSSAEEHR